MQRPVEIIHELMFSAIFVDRKPRELPGEFIQRLNPESREELSKLTAKDVSQVPQHMEVYNKHGKRNTQ